MAKQQTNNRNLPGVKPKRPMPFTNAPDGDTSITPKELAELDQMEAGLRDGVLAVKDLAEAESSSSNVNPVDDFYNDNFGTAKQTSPSTKQSGFRPTIGSSSQEADGESSKKKSTKTKTISSNSEAQKLSDTIDKYNQQWIKDIGERIDQVESQKVSRLNIRGRARKRVRMLALGAVFAIAVAVPIGILGVIPHAMQSWIQNKVSAYTERAVDKMGQKVLYSYMKNRVAVEKCKTAYNLAGNVAGINACRPRIEERDTRLSQLFNDWQAAKIEDSLSRNGVNVEYDYSQRDSGRPYKVTINRPESEGGNFQASGKFGVPDLDTAEFVGRREASLIIRKELKASLKNDTKWHQYLKRRNLKAGYLRDLGLPGRVFTPQKVAKKLDDITALKKTATSDFRKYLTKFVVNKGNARVGLLLEILLSGESSRASPSNLIEENRAIAAAADRLGVEKVTELLDKYGGKSLQEIEVQIVKDLINKLNETLAEKFGETATKAIPVIGWVMLALTVLDALDLATDGTLQHFISSQNAQSMLDVANLLDTTISEEKRSYVDLQSAGDMRLSLINGLGSSRLFADMVGYKSINGKKPAGYNCKPNISISDPASLGSGIEEIFSKGDPSNLKQVGMADDQNTCENHRVDYDPLNPLSSLFSFVQNGAGAYQGLSTYTSGCILSLVASGGINSQPDLPFCPSLQETYHGAQGGFSRLISLLSLDRVANFIAEIPPIKALMQNVTGWISNGLTILITGQSLAGPELLQGGLKTDTKSGARMVDAWIGGGEVQQSAFAKGVGDGGGLGGIPLTPDQAASLNQSIAAERREELASSSFFDRMFDISHSDTLASGFIGMAVTEGGYNNFINPFNNIALAFSGGSKTAFADSNSDTCTQENKKGQAITDFGVICYGIPDSYIDGLTEEQIQDLSDAERCEDQTSAIDAKRKAAEDGTDPNLKDPDGSGTSTEIDGCRLLCTVTDTMGTNFRIDDKICGFENFDTTSSDNGGTSDVNDQPLEGALGKCESVAVTRPNSGKPKNDIEVQVVPGTSIDIRAEYCTNVDNMVKAAAADGVKLDGNAFRSYDEQVDLRRRNCGSSNYAIIERPPGECSPPTARPGTSNHEGGVAIDFKGCSTRQTSCYKWLAGNAAKYGFKNYPKEAWHWSINGR